MRLQETLLGEVLDFHDHQRVPLSSLERETRQGDYRYYGAQGVIDHIDAYIFDGQFILIAEDGANLVTRNEPIAFLVDGQFWVNNHAHVVKGKEGVADDYYITALLNSLNIAGFVTGAAQPKLSQQNLKQIRVSLPDYEAQRAVAEILSAYDDLIANNRRRMALLEEAAMELYREWFGRLRFPGHEHTRIVEGLPEGWQRLDLGTVAENLDRMRVPLSVFERESRPGDYPYHGAAGILDHIDGFIFNGRFVLVGEDGTVQTPAGTPMLQFVEGKFWVSNHAHVLRGNTVSTEFLDRLLSGYPITGHVTGVAQPKLTQANLNRIPAVVPTPLLLDGFQRVVETMFDQLFVLQTQNEKLRAARELLLPRLMSGAMAA